jgi:hypothetical protein
LERSNTAFGEPGFGVKSYSLSARPSFMKP